MNNALSKTWEILKKTTLYFLQDNCMMLSSSISFYFLLSMIPFTTLSLIIFNFIYAGFADGTAPLTELSGLLSSNIREIVPFIPADWFENNIIHPQASKPFTIINLVILPVTCGLILNVLDTAYRRIFKLAPRHFLLTRAVYALLSVFLIVLLFVANFVMAILLPVISKIVAGSGAIARIMSVVFQNLPFLELNLISPAVFIIFYLVAVKIFLNIKIKWRYRLATGFLFYFSWLISKMLFGFYINNITNFNLVYGSLSSIIIILFWVYYSGITLLFSVEMMYVLHAQRTDSNSVDFGQTPARD